MPTLRRLKYVQSYISRGHAYYYFRRAGTRIPLPGPFGSSEFMAAYAEALGGDPETTTKIGASRTKPGSVTALIAFYVETAEFKGLASETQRQRWSIMRRLQNDAGDNPVRLLTRERVAQKLSTLTPFMHRNYDRALRPLFAHAVNIGWTKENPFDQIKKPKLPKSKGFKAWTEADVEKYEARHPIGSKARLALDLLLYTGVRRSDVVKLGPQMERDGKLIFTETKGRGRIVKNP